MTHIEALAAIRPHIGSGYVTITSELVDCLHPVRREVEFTIYVAGLPGLGAMAHESASTLEDAVAIVLAKIRPQPADPVAVADAAIAGLDDARR